MRRHSVAAENGTMAGSSCDCRTYPVSSRSTGLVTFRDMSWHLMVNNI
jgi:hypothetical protein